MAGMGIAERRADAQSRLRKAHATLGAARVLLGIEQCRDDAVNRASIAALNAARALIDSQWARDSNPGWDPTWRPGMPKPGQLAPDRFSADAMYQLLDRFEKVAQALWLPPDYTQYLRTLVEDGLDADHGESPGYDADEAMVAIATAEQLILVVAQQLGLAEELDHQPVPAQPQPSSANVQTP
jgi:hypothetical protein